MVENNSYDVELSSFKSSTYYSHYQDGFSDLTYDDVVRLVKSPMLNNQILRKLSAQMYNVNGIYAQTINNRVDMPSLDYILSSNSTVRALNAKSKFRKMFDLLKHKTTTRDILMKLERDGMYVGILRDTTANNKDIDTGYTWANALDRIEGLSLDDNFMIQPLDLDYCKIIGFQNNIKIAGFDLQYFDQFKHGGLINEIKNYPPEFKRAYMAYKRDGSKRMMVLDYRNTIALTARATLDEPYGRPLGLSALADIKFSEDYDQSQNKLIKELASSIYYLILPEGEKKGKSSLTKQQQDALILAFENAVRLSDSDRSKISTLSVAPGTQVDRLSKDSSLIKDNINDENMQKISTSLGFASSALNGQGQGANYSSLQVNIDLMMVQVFKMVGQIAEEYTRILNHHIGLKPSEYVKIKYMNTSLLNQDKSYSMAKELYTLGMGSLKHWIATAQTGLDVEEYIELMREEKAEGLYDEFKPHETSFTMSGKSEAGREKKDDGDLTDSGANTRGSGGNNLERPSKN